MLVAEEWSVLYSLLQIPQPVLPRLLFILFINFVQLLFREWRLFESGIDFTQPIPLLT